VSLKQSIQGALQRLLTKSSAHHYAVIMAGGRGERFWPLSRERRPKQLLKLIGDKSLLEATIDRLQGVVPRGHIWIITNRQQAAAIRDLVPGVPDRQIIAEPEGRDSAGAVLLGAAFIGREDPHATIAFLPADQYVADEPAYRAALRKAFEEAAKSDCVVTLGQKPDYPHTGYGYIESGKVLSKTKTVSVHRVKQFREKPDLATAKRMVRDGDFFWNLGIFVWSVQTIKKGFQNSRPHALAWWEAIQRPAAFLAGGFKKLPKISIDYAVMEKMKNILVVAGRFGWDDIGSWNALFQHFKTDAAGNILRGQVVSHDSSNCLAIAGKTTIALLGVQGLVVVQTPDAILICDRAKGQEIKKIVAMLPKDLR
jgi:mannose-1-phosphate guanylyltransferase